MRSNVRVTSPPAKPLMIYDGDCCFCTLWIRRWQASSCDSVDFLPSQDPVIRRQYPEIPPEAFQSAVLLVGIDGSVWSGAEAVFRALEGSPHGHWPLDFYQHAPIFARVADGAYGFVASHRSIFSVLTRWLWGWHVDPPALGIMRRVFLRSLALIYLVAFVSLWVQISGLIGRDGIVPASTVMHQAREQLDALHIGMGRYRLLPTLCWWNSSDAFLQIQCGAGTVLAAFALCGVAQAPCFLLLWALYLSLTTAGGVFLAFQWDNLLLETGFLAIFLAPLRWISRRTSREAPTSKMVVWLLRWLLFRLMFESGCVKLLSGDPTWHNLSALHYHFETQPLPTWIGWFAHQLPTAIQKGLTAGMFAIELVVPFFYFTPRRLRMAAAAITALLQILILLTGNYGFFNLLALALCIPLLDDATLTWVGSKIRILSAGAEPNSTQTPRCLLSGRRWPSVITVPLAIVIVAASLVQLLGMFRLALPGPRPVLALVGWLQPFRSVNNYGLFSIMTTTRPEIVIQGSYDGVQWQAYVFKYKPGDLRRRPSFVEPHQPRLDWQMWFAALGNARDNPWMVNFCVRLLQGSPAVMGLLETNPFPMAPPRYVRAELYDYRFTDLSTWRKTGDWWVREDEGPYLPPISLKDPLEARRNP